MGRTTQWAERSARSKGRGTIGDRATGRSVTLAALAELRRDYVHSMRERLLQLSSALSDWRAAPWDEGLRELARHLAHRLRGSAGSFDLAAVGAAAGVIEDLVVREIDETGEDQSNSERWARIELALEHAHRRIADAIRDLDPPVREGGTR